MLTGSLQSSPLCDVYKTTSLKGEQPYVVTESAGGMGITTSTMESRPQSIGTSRLTGTNSAIPCHYEMSTIRNSTTREVVPRTTTTTVTTSQQDQNNNYPWKKYQSSCVQTNQHVAGRKYEQAQTQVLHNSTEYETTHFNSTPAMTGTTYQHTQINAMPSITGGNYQYAQGQHVHRAAEYETTHINSKINSGQEERSRKISSVVVESALVGEVPQDTVRYVQVPVYEEEVEYVPVKETRVIPCRAEPEIQYVDKVVYNEVKQEAIEEKLIPNRLGPIIKQVVKEDPNKPAKITEQIFKEQPVPNFVDHEVPVIVSQVSKPMITEHSERVEIQARDFQPEILPVDLHLVRPIENTLQLVDSVKSKHKLVDIGAAQYNTLLRSLNAGIDCELPYVSQNGRIEYVSEHDLKYTIAPKGIVIEGWHPKTRIHQTHTDLTSANSCLKYQATGAVGQIISSGASKIQTVARNGHRHIVDANSGVQDGISLITKSGTANLTVSNLGAGNRTDELTSSAYSASRLTKPRSPIQTNLKSGGIQNESQSSSVSSSINRIASQIHGRSSAKRSYLCCGNASQQQSPSKVLTDYNYQINAQDAVETIGSAANSALGRVHHSIRREPITRNEAAMLLPNSGQLTSHHISVGPTNRQARVC